MLTGPPNGRPRLAARARLRRCTVSDQWMLLYPERGLVLNSCAAELVALCTGDRSVTGIVDTLAERHDAPRQVVERDVVAFLDLLSARALLVWEES
ncbi:MAG: pyrroloquinoline quinone biosynthesis peptide chaperone PqqD [Polyangiaceae bacterium]|nr:pyrroloquinoline quinone biosynthesis peptide chaperone PqqD [Polyangiaceae bacterium]